MKKLIIFLIFILFAFSLFAGSPDSTKYQTDPRPWHSVWRFVRGWVTYGDTTLYNKRLQRPELYGTIYLENGETISNHTDAKVKLEFNDDAALLGEVIIASKNDTPNVSDNDHIDVLFRAEDDSSGTTDWTKIINTITDASDETEDSKMGFQVLTAGSASVPLELTGNTMTLDNGATIVNGDASNLTVTEANVEFVSGVFKQSYDALAYWTATQADGGQVTFNSVSDGTAGFTFSDIVTINANIVLENDEIIGNATDADFTITFDDDAATLGQLIIASSNDTPNVANNDLLEMIFRFEDDSSGTTDWGVIQVKATDVSDESEDSQILFKVFGAGTQVTPLTLSTGTLTLQNSETIDNATDNTVQIVSNIVKHAYDALAYYTITQADGGGVTLNSVSDGTAGFTFSDAVTFGSDGSGVDVVFYSSTSGDTMLWDASEECLVITGTDNQDALQVTDGDLAVTDDAMIGTVNWGGTSDNDAGTDDYNCTIDPAPAAYKTGQFYFFKPDTLNTGACTINFNSLGDKNIKTASGADPANSDIVTTTITMLIYDGTNMLLVNPATTCD